MSPIFSGSIIPDLSWNCASRYWTSLRAIQCASCSITSLPPFSPSIMPNLTIVSLPSNNMTRITSNISDPTVNVLAIPWNEFTNLQVGVDMCHTMYHHVSCIISCFIIYHVPCIMYYHV